MKPNLVFVHATIFLLTVAIACKKSEQSAGTTAEKSSDKVSPLVPAQKTEETILLKAQWPVGNKYTYRMDLAQASTMQFPGMAKPMQQEITMAQTYSLSVPKERATGGRELEIQFIAMELDFKMGDMTMSFDSKIDTSSDKDAFLAPYRKMIGSKLHFLLDAENHLESVENLEEWQNTVLADSPPPAQMMIRGTYSPEFFKQLVENTRGMPSHPVKIGESWPYKTEVPTGQMGKILLDTQVKLKGFESHEGRRCAVLESNGTIKGGATAAPGPMGGKVNLQQGKVSGTSWFDPELGALIEAKSDQKMQFKIEPPQGAPGGGNPMTSDVSQKVTIKLVELGKINQ